MKLLFDFLPIILFFIAYKVGDAHADAAARFATDHLGFIVSGGVVGPGEAPVLLATVVVIVATVLQISTFLALRRKVDAILWVTLGIVTVLGGATIWFHNPTFIKWKPTALFWAMGIVFCASQVLFRKNLLKSVVGEQIELPERVWQRLTVAWVAFFALMGLANLYVAFNFETSTWVNFKVFGLTALMVVFILAQGFAVARYIEVDDDDAPAADSPARAQGERA